MRSCTFFDGSISLLYLRQGRYDEAESLLLAMHEQVVGGGDESPSKIHKSIERLVSLYASWHAAEPGQDYDAKAAAWRAKLPDTDPDSPSP